MSRAAVRTLAIAGALLSMSGCFDLVVEASDAPFPPSGLTVQNPTPRTGNSLVVSYTEPVTVVGRECCLFREVDGTRAESPFSCIEIGDAARTRTATLEGLVFDELVDVVAVVFSENRASSSSEVRASGRVLMDAPGLIGFEALLDDEGRVLLSWSLPEQTFTATGVVVARGAEAPPSAPDDADAVVVHDEDLTVTSVVDLGVKGDTLAHYAAWVRDREGGLTGPFTTSVRTPVDPVTNLAVTLDDAFGALLGTASITWTDPAAETPFVVDVVRAPFGVPVGAPGAALSTLVCTDVAAGGEGCTDGAVPTGTLTYHAFVDDGGEGPRRAETVDLASPDLRVDLFLATPTAAGAELTWQTSGDASAVRIVRSLTDYALGPEDPIATFVVEQASPPFVDTGVAPGETVFYVAFPVGAAGGLTGPGRRTSTEPLSGPVTNLVVASAYVGAWASGDVEVSWEQPLVGSYSSARVLRTASADPTGPDDGVVVCEEALLFCLDTEAAHEQTARYAVWARDAFGAFTDTPAVGEVLVNDDLPPAAALGLAASREPISDTEDRVTLTFALAGDDTISRVHVWRGNLGEPPSAPGAIGAVLVDEEDGAVTSMVFDVFSGGAVDLSLFLDDDAGNTSPPSSISIPPSTGLALETWGNLWVPGRIVEGYAGENRVFTYDATTSTATACSVDVDVGDDGPGPGDTTYPATLSGYLDLALDETSRVTFVCDTPGGTLQSSLLLWIADLAFARALTVAPAIPRDVGVGVDGVSYGLVANQILRVDEEGAVLGIDTLAPLTGFGPPASPIGVAEHLDVFADGSVAIAAEGYVAGQNLPLGVKLAGGGAYEAHLIVTAFNLPTLADIAVVDDGPHAGDVWIAGTTESSLTIREGTTAAPGTATASVLAPYGGRDVFLARIGTGGPEETGVGGSAGDDFVAGIVEVTTGGVAIAGTLGAAPAAFDTHIVDDNAVPPWGFVAFADDTGAFTSAEPLASMDSVDAIAAHPTGGVVVAGRSDTQAQLSLARRGEGLPAALRWTRTVNTCCLADAKAGDVFGRVTGLAVDDEGFIWAVGYTYGREVVFNGFESDVPEWRLLYPAYPSKLAGTFVARYDETGALVFARTIVTPESTTARIDHRSGQNGAEFFAVFASIRNPTVLDDVYPQTFGPASIFSMPSDLQLGETGGVLMKLGPVPPPLAPPTSFTATPAVGPPHSVALQWTLPNDAQGTRVVVVRRLDQPAIGPADDEAVVVHDDEGSLSATDTNVPAGRWFYRAYRVSTFPRAAESPAIEHTLP